MKSTTFLLAGAFLVAGNAGAQPHRSEGADIINESKQIAAEARRVAREEARNAAGPPERPLPRIPVVSYVESEHGVRFKITTGPNGSEVVPKDGVPTVSGGNRHREWVDVYMGPKGRVLSPAEY